MRQFKIIIASVLLVAAIVVLVVLLFNPQPIQILLESGQEVVTQSSDYFTITTVIIFMICSFIIGSSITYLYYNAEVEMMLSKKQEKTDKYKDNKEHDLGHETHGVDYDIIIPLLRDDEKKAVKILRENNGEMLQNALVLKLGLSKVKTTRILIALERKQVIVKQRHGLTNHIKLRYNK